MRLGFCIAPATNLGRISSLSMSSLYVGLVIGVTAGNVQPAAVVISLAVAMPVKFGFRSAALG